MNLVWGILTAAWLVYAMYIVTTQNYTKRHKTILIITGLLILFYMIFFITPSTQADDNEVYINQLTEDTSVWVETRTPLLELTVPPGIYQVNAQFLLGSFYGTDCTVSLGAENMISHIYGSTRTYYDEADSISLTNVLTLQRETKIITTMICSNYTHLYSQPIYGYSLDPWDTGVGTQLVAVRIK